MPIGLRIVFVAVMCTRSAVGLTGAPIVIIALIIVGFLMLLATVFTAASSKATVCVFMFVFVIIVRVSLFVFVNWLSEFFFFVIIS